MGEYIFVLIILIIFSAFFSSAETALFSLSETRLRTLVDQKKKGAEILYKLRKNARKLIITILLGNNIVNIAASSFATVLAVDLLGDKGVGVAIGIMTFLILVFGEIIPKSVAIEKAEDFSLFFAKPILFLMHFFSPLVWILEKTTKVVAPRKMLITGEEIKTIATMGFESGSIKKEEEKIIKKAIEFADIDAKDVMTPRIDMFSLDSELNLKDVLSDIASGPFSRIPIYSNNKDNITGILYIKDVLKYISKNGKDIRLADLSRKAFFIPEKMAVNNLFKEFKQQHIHIAIVVDEHGGVMGLVTMEDLLEELVGEITDESDISKDVIKRIDKKTILVDGDTEVENINDFLNIKLPGKASDTISALILEKIEKIPKIEEKIEIDGIILTIIEVTDKEIKKIKIQKE